jgi:hypothetical protein
LSLGLKLLLLLLTSIFSILSFKILQTYFEAFW